jgi:uncharacterized phage-associated protein
MCADTFKYKSTVVAKYIISQAIEKKIVLNMTKLQKLLYAAYGVYLAVKNSKLVNEQPKAWPYGPVFPTTRKKLLSMDFNDYDITSDNECSEILHDEEVTSLIRLVLRDFGKLNAAQLTQWSHQSGSPWEKTCLHPDFKWNAPIPDEYIAEYFSSIIKQSA